MLISGQCLTSIQSSVRFLYHGLVTSCLGLDLGPWVVLFIGLIKKTDSVSYLTLFKMFVKWQSIFYLILLTLCSWVMWLIKLLSWIYLVTWKMDDVKTVCVCVCVHTRFHYDNTAILFSSSWQIGMTGLPSVNKFDFDSHLTLLLFLHYLGKSKFHFCVYFLKIHFSVWKYFKFILNFLLI